MLAPIAAGVTLVLAPFAHAGGSNLMIRSVVGNDGFCMDVARDTKASGTPVFMYRCHGRENQRWTTTQGEGGQSILVGIGGLCLDVRGKHSRQDGTPVEVWSCHYGANQRFNVGRDGRIKEIESGKCLVPVQQRDAAPIVLDDCTGQADEIWDVRH